MVVSEMLSEIRDHGFDDLTDTRILGFLNAIYRNVCTRYPWPFMERTATLTVNANGLVTSPTDINKIVRIVNTATGQRVRPRRMDDFTSSHSAHLDLGGDPLEYYFIGSQIYVWPISTSAPLTVRYIRRVPALTVSPDAAPILPEDHHDVLILGALIRCYMMEDDFENSAMFTNAFEKRFQDMMADLIIENYDQTDTILDVDETDYVDLLM